MIVKLIASDIDGTLLLGDEREISDKVITYINKLYRRGVVFSAASGRQYSNLRNLFGPVKDKIAYICENGALIKYNDKIIKKTPLDRKLGEELLNDIYKVNGCEFLLSGEDTSYIMPKSATYKDHIENYVGNKVQVIEKYEDVKEDFIKISVYCESGIEKHAKYFYDKWKDKVKTTVSGKCWLDFVAPNVDKGMALAVLKEYFGADYEETMCFGDNFNDIEMFDESYYSYAISTSHKDIRAKAKFITSNVESILFDVEMMYEWQK